MGVSTPASFIKGLWVVVWEGEGVRMRPLRDEHFFAKPSQIIHGNLSKRRAQLEKWTAETFAYFLYVGNSDQPSSGELPTLFLFTNLIFLFQWEWLETKFDYKINHLKIEIFFTVIAMNYAWFHISNDSVEYPDELHIFLYIYEYITNAC